VVAVFGLGAAAFGFGVAAGLAAGAFGSTSAAAGVASSGVATSASATPTVLESTLWQFSQVTNVRISAPSCRSSMRSVRVRAQKGQNATSVVTLI
jgi:hypothetical protein